MVATERAASAPARPSWGLYAIACAIGLATVAYGDIGARFDANWSLVAFWSGLALMFVPICFRLASPGASRSERAALLMILGVALYLVKVLQSPFAFTYSDELSHLRNVEDAIDSGRLFGPNPLLPVSAYFPGLAGVTDGVVAVTGLPSFEAGLLVIGVARVVLIGALFLLFESVLESAALGSLAVLLYIANPNFLFFDAQFAYESLALSLAPVVFLAIILRLRSAGARQLSFTLLAVVGVGATVVTHHLTAYALTAFLAVWAVVEWFSGAGERRVRGMATISFVAAFSWLIYVAVLTIGYLGSNVVAGLAELLRLIAREGSSRELFRSYAGVSSPLIEQIVGYAGVAVVLSFGVVGALRVLRARTLSLAKVFALASLAYPASLALRLTARGAEISNRSSEFLYVPLAFAVTIGLVSLRPREVWRRSLLTAFITIAFASGVIVGWPIWARLPGPYLVIADTRSIEAESLAATGWTAQTFPADTRLLADRTNRLLLGSYGRMHPVTAYGDGSGAAAVFFTDRLGPDELGLLQEAGIRLVVVDKRISEGLPLVGVYFEQGEPDALRHDRPIPAQNLDKFDRATQFDRIFDSGNVVIYEVVEAANAR